MTSHRWQPALWMVLGTAFLVTAFLFINTTFMLYDDEGYLLLTLRNFLRGGRLYDEIFTQYGPWPYVYHQLAAVLTQQPLTHDFGRNLTAGHWVLCALLSGAIVSKVTGRMPAALFSASATFTLLWQMSAEPSHPGSLIAGLVAVSALLVVLLAWTDRRGMLPMGLGAIAAMLLLTKINIGLLFLSGTGVAALHLTAWPAAWQRPARWLAAAGLLAVPWVLMGQRISEPRVLIFASQFTAAAAGLLWIAPPVTNHRHFQPRAWLPALVVFLGVLSMIVLAVWLQGTSLPVLLEMVLFTPLRQPARFLITFQWPWAVWPVSAICWLLVARAGWELRRNGSLTPTTRRLLIGLRLATALAFLIGAQAWLEVRGIGRFAAFCLPLLPAFLVPLVAADQEAKTKRDIVFWLGCIALPQALHAYPVAGSQMGWGTFLFMPILVIGLHDAWQALGSIWPRWPRLLPYAAWGPLGLVSLWQLASLAAICREHYVASKPLGLPGAGNLRLPDHTRLSLRLMTLNAAVHADVLFSRPGMFSYNIWSGVPTPTAQNATHWFWLLKESHQQDIMHQLRANPRSAVIVNPDWDDFLEKINVPISSPLQAFIDAHYRPILELAGPRFLVPRESRAIPFGKIELHARDPVQGDVGEPLMLRTNVVLDGQPSAVALQDIAMPWGIRINYTTTAARIFLQPITSEGEKIGPVIQLPTPGPVKGLFQLTIFAPEIPPAPLLKNTVLVVQAPDGQVLSESIF